MKNVIRTLSLALTVGLFLSAATPANAQFFPEPFQPGCRALPVKVQEAQPAPEKQMLEIKTANPVVKKQTPDNANWNAPVTNPTQYAPMQQVQQTTPPTTLKATPPIAIPVHNTQTGDRWLDPTTTATPYEPMR